MKLEDIYYIAWNYWRDIKEWVLYHTVHRHHILNLSCNEYGYKYGWLDTDTKILIANFQLLKKFVEHEKEYLMSVELKLPDYGEPSGADDKAFYDSVEAQNNADKEIHILYHWWMTTRPAKVKEFDEKLDVWYRNRTTESPFAIENDMLRQDNEMLDRLMKIRSYLWT